LANNLSRAGQSEGTSVIEWHMRVTESGAEAAPRGRWLRVSAIDLATGRTNVSLRLPIALADVALSLGATWLPGVSASEITRLIQRMRDGESVNAVVAVDEACGERVEVVIE